MDTQRSLTDGRQQERRKDNAAQPALFHRVLTAEEVGRLRATLDSNWLPGDSQELRIVLQLERNSPARGWIICAGTPVH